jgi:predicted PurR-regulated permease PerM
MSDTRFRNSFLHLLVTGISVSFVAMIREFLVTILLAPIFTGLSYPVYQWLLARLGGGRQALLYSVQAGRSTPNRDLAPE